MVRSMSSACGKINEDRFIRCECLLILNPAYSLVGHVSGEMIIRVMWHFYLGDTVINQWSILICFPANEAVELIEAGMSGPAVIRTGNRNFPGRSFVVFSESSRAETILSQHFCHRRDGLGTNTSVSRPRAR